MKALNMSAHHDPAVAEGSAAVFHAHDVTKIYTMGEVEVHALHSVTLDLYDGEFVVLLGPSGSGKSTLLNILGALDVPGSRFGGKVQPQDFHTPLENPAKAAGFH